MRVGYSSERTTPLPIASRVRCSGWRRGVRVRGGRMSRSKTMQAVVLSWVLFAMGFVTLADESKPPEGGMPGQNVLITLTASKTGGPGPGGKTTKVKG